MTPTTSGTTASRARSDAAPDVRAHGGPLVQRWATAEQAARLFEDWSRPRVRLAPHQLSDAVLIANGAFSPLAGFLTSRDYELVLEEMRLASGTLWPIPVTLTVPEDHEAASARSDVLVLESPAGEPVGWIEVEERYRIDPLREARHVYGTEESRHPGVARLLGAGRVNLAGQIRVMREAIEPPYPGYPSEPLETRALFAERGWRTIVAFQTRNPIHRAHEYIQKCALEIVDGLFLHPLVGETRGEDVPADVRMRCYEALLGNYYPKSRTLMGVYPAAMRYAGPREAVFHAIARRNYGCTHFIVGRDHAGVGGYYGTYAAQDLLREISVADLGITPLFFDNTFWCRSCGHMASEKTCPHPSEQHVALSGTEVRRMLTAGEDLPLEFTRREIAEILGAHYRGARADA